MTPRRPGRGTIARRRAVAAGLVVVLALAAMWAVQRYKPGDITSASAAAHGATIVRYTVRSRFVRRTLPQTAAIPADASERPPLLVFLHGRGEGGEESNSNADFYGALAALGDRAPAVVFPNSDSRTGLFSSDR